MLCRIYASKLNARSSLLQENKLKEIDEQVDMIRETLSPSITGRDLAWKIVTTLRDTTSRDTSLEEIDEFRSEISEATVPQKRRPMLKPNGISHTVYPDQPAESFGDWTANFTPPRSSPRRGRLQAQVRRPLGRLQTRHPAERMIDNGYLGPHSQEPTYQTTFDVPQR